MSDEIKITVLVNGKKVPVSNISLETFSKIRDAESDENAPVFSIAKNKTNGDNVLIIKLTEKCVRNLEDAISYKDSYISLTEDGDWNWGFDDQETFATIKKRFKDVKPLFKEK